MALAKSSVNPSKRFWNFRRQLMAQNEAFLTQDLRELQIKNAVWKIAQFEQLCYPQPSDVWFPSSLFFSKRPNLLRTGNHQFNHWNFIHRIGISVLFFESSNIAVKFHHPFWLFLPISFEWKKQSYIYQRPPVNVMVPVRSTLRLDFLNVFRDFISFYQKILFYIQEFYFCCSEDFLSHFPNLEIIKGYRILYVVYVLAESSSTLRNFLL